MRWGSRRGKLGSRQTRRARAPMGGSSQVGNDTALRWARWPLRYGGKNRTLRVKQRRARSAEEGAWRAAMASAFMLVLGARDPEAAKSAIIARAEFVGEGEFARRAVADARRQILAKPVARISGQNRNHLRNRLTA